MHPMQAKAILGAICASRAKPLIKAATAYARENIPWLAFIKGHLNFCSSSLTRAFIKTSASPDAAPTMTIETANCTGVTAKPGNAKEIAKTAPEICMPRAPKIRSNRGAIHIELTKPKALHSNNNPKLASLTPNRIFTSGT